MEAPLKLSLGMPVYDSAHVETMLCLILALKQAPWDVHLNFWKGTYLNQSRNRILERAHEAKADYLMFVDSDVTFPPDGIETLMSRGKDIIGGMYNTKTTPPANTIKISDKEGNLIDIQKFEIPKEPFKCRAVPTGFMLIRLEAIRNMKNPFDFGHNSAGEFIGEDVNFCIRAQDELGLEVWCDPTIPIGHIGSYLY